MVRGSLFFALKPSGVKIAVRQLSKLARTAARGWLEHPGAVPRAGSPGGAVGRVPGAATRGTDLCFLCFLCFLQPSGQADAPLPPPWLCLLLLQLRPGAWVAANGWDQGAHLGVLVQLLMLFLFV